MRHTFTGKVDNHVPITTDDGTKLIDVEVSGEWGCANFSMSPENAEEHYPMQKRVIVTVEVE